MGMKSRSPLECLSLAFTEDHHHAQHEMKVTRLLANVAHIEDQHHVQHQSHSSNSSQITRGTVKFSQLAL